MENKTESILDFKTRRALIIDDSKSIRGALSNIVSSYDYEVETCPDAETGFQAYQKHAFILVLIDRILPGMDGLTLCKKIRAISRSSFSTIIIITNQDDPESLKAALDAGADDYILKSAGMKLIDIRLNIADKLSRNRLQRRMVEEKYQPLFEDSKDMIFIGTPEGVITDINQAGVDLLGYTDKSEIISKSTECFYQSGDTLSHINQQIQEKGYVKDFELLLQKKDGEKIFVLATITAIKNDEGKMIETRGIVKDISDRIDQERQFMIMNIELTDTNQKLKETQARLVQQEKLSSIGHLAAGVAHEINNPLGFIKSNFVSLRKYTGNVRKYIESLDKLISVERSVKVAELKKEMKLDFILKDLDALFNESQDGFDRIISIIQGLKNFSRVDYTGEVSEFDLNKEIENTLIVARNEIKYTAEIKKDLGQLPHIEGRASEINQVLLNIIMNAVDAIKEQKRTEPGNILISTFQSGDYVVCRITDDGPGIPEKIRRSIFNPFFTTKEVGMGTGLGLSISYDIIAKKHMGELSIDSEPGKGTTFTIKLPVEFKGGREEE